MGYRGTRTKTLMCSALVQIIYVEHDSGTIVLNKYSKWVSLKLHAIKFKETIFLGKFLIKMKPKRVCTIIYIYFIINSISCYMFRPPVMAIVREVFFEEYITQDVKTICRYEMLSYKENYKDRYSESNTTCEYIILFKRCSLEVTTTNIFISCV